VTTPAASVTITGSASTERTASRVLRVIDATSAG